MVAVDSDDDDFYDRTDVKAKVPESIAFTVFFRTICTGHDGSRFNCIGAICTRLKRNCLSLLSVRSVPGMRHQIKCVDPLFSVQEHLSLVFLMLSVPGMKVPESNAFILLFSTICTRPDSATKIHHEAGSVLR